MHMPSPARANGAFNTQQMHLALLPQSTCELLHERSILLLRNVQPCLLQPLLLYCLCAATCKSCVGSLQRKAALALLRDWPLIRAPGPTTIVNQLGGWAATACAAAEADGVPAWRAVEALGHRCLVGDGALRTGIAGRTALARLQIAHFRDDAHHTKGSEPRCVPQRMRHMLL